MPIALDFFVKYGYAVVLLWVLTEQLGFPIPSTPLLLTAGTLTATHSAESATGMGGGAGGQPGRGYRLVHLRAALWVGGGAPHVPPELREFGLCAQDGRVLYPAWRDGSFGGEVHSGPGLGGGSIAGQIGMGFGKFLLFDAGGVLLWAVSVTLGGYFFGDILKLHPGALSWTLHFFGLLFALLFLGFLVWRMLQRRAFLRSVRMARLEPRDLKGMLDAGQPVFIVDLRHPLDYLPDPRTLPGALSLTPDKLVAESEKIPRDQEVVLFCTCPSEATAAKMALQLRRMGIHRVRPLRGGYDEWKRLGYPLVDITAQSAPAA